MFPSANDLMLSERANKMKQVIINVILLIGIALVVGILSLYVSYAAITSEMNTRIVTMESFVNKMAGYNLNLVQQSLIIDS